MEEDAKRDGEQREERTPATWPPPPPRATERTPAPWPPRPRTESDEPVRPPWERSDEKQERSSDRAWSNPEPRPAPWDRPARREESTGGSTQSDAEKTMAWQPTRSGTEVPRRDPVGPTPRPVTPPAQPRPQTPPPTSAGAQAQTQRTYAREAQPADQRGTVAVRRLRRGRLAIRKIDPWAVFKFSLVFYFCMLLIAMFTVAIIFLVMQVFGVIDNIEKFLRDLDLTVTITGTFLFRWFFLVGLAGTLIASAVTMFMAFLYNLIADVVGGIELLVTERE